MIGRDDISVDKVRVLSSLAIALAVVGHLLTTSSFVNEGPRFSFA